MSSYQELYKKYRPKTWDDLVGQDAVVKNLREDIKTGQVPTAYLFAGKQHGCGKTSAAWIMAKAVNCENLDLETGNPCNECQTCVNIDNNRQLGVQYVSMANNGSVADANAIIGQAQMAQQVKRPVWILDESHSMSKAAAEAWLIPLESTNMKALFIFCSTEPEKMIPTVKSRVQQKRFRSIDAIDIFKYLKSVSDKEGFDLSNEKIKDAALAGAGSLRTAMQNLEVVALDGTLPTSYKNKVLSMLASRNYAKALEVSGEMEANGIDYVEATEQLYRDFSDMLLILSGAEVQGEVGSKESYKVFARTIGPNAILHVLKHLGDALNTMIYNTVSNRILFEIAIFNSIGAIRPYMKKSEGKSNE